MLGLTVGSTSRIAISESCFCISKAFASGRWWPQPLSCIYYCCSNAISSSYSSKLDKLKDADSIKKMDLESTAVVTAGVVSPSDNIEKESSFTSSLILSPSDNKLLREAMAPIYAKPRGNGKNVYKTEVYRNGELLANYVLFEDSMAKSKVPWNTYTAMTTEERDIYMAHLKAIRERRLTYKDPITKSIVKTVSHHLLRGKCCGDGCRHCPYQHENVTPEMRRSRIWNGNLHVSNSGNNNLDFVLYFRHELSRHRTRPPSSGIHRRTRLLVVDNSALGKEANTSGKLAYCIDVKKPGGRKKHMPHARLGDKILVAIRGEMKQAFVVGAKIHVDYRKHGIPSTDTNNIVLLDDEGNPLGTRVLVPIPAVLQRKRANLQFSKILSIATKYF
ncbi:unnamed protein product [Thelazia callipaeda]|uniref:Large ribosomal subunit protein uL14m n=1 Tax=Thelazia callipaeda TaxID=103827 RepID=A0A0N5D3L3_THECL|nr:unnamed protein product [Thelazia callipaeda]